MNNQLIYSIKEIDELIINSSGLELNHLFQLAKVNKYYNNYVSNLPLIKEIKEYKVLMTNNYKIIYLSKFAAMD